jgi:hypothetical protein
MFSFILKDIKVSDHDQLHKINEHDHSDFQIEQAYHAEGAHDQTSSLPEIISRLVNSNGYFQHQFESIRNQLNLLINGQSMQQQMLKSHETRINYENKVLNNLESFLKFQHKKLQRHANLPRNLNNRSNMYNRHDLYDNHDNYSHEDVHERYEQNDNFEHLSYLNSIWKK